MRQIGFRLAAIFAAAMTLGLGLPLAVAPAQAETFWQRVIRGGHDRPGAGRQQMSNTSPIARQTVRYEGPHGPNTIVIDTSERRLYYTLGNGRAIKYGVGVGRDGFTWSGSNRISRKAEWPGWTPPAQMPGGPNNPLGARALYIGSTLYRIHGTNQPWTIGQAMSSGCIRMANDDVVHLYGKVNVGTRVVVRH
jgi:lipoprotein-anchoring transpeptidase ErfK/SrfK